MTSSDYINLSYKKTVITNYVSSDLDQQINECFSSKNLLYIIGDSASGKTQLARNYIKTQYTTSAKGTFRAKEISDYDLKSLLEEEKDILNSQSNLISYLANAPGITLILLDVKYIDTKLKWILSKISNVNTLRVIVTATSALNADNGNIISTNERPDCFFKEIFLTYINDKKIVQKISETEFHHLFQFLNRSPKNVRLLAITINELIQNNGFSLSKEWILNIETWLGRTLNLPKIRDPHTDEHKNIEQYKVPFITHLTLQALYDTDDSFIDTVMPTLCIRAKKPILIENVLCNTSLEYDDITYAIDLKFIEYTDTNQTQIRMNPLMYYCFWYIYTSGKKYHTEERFDSLTEMHNLSFYENVFRDLVSCYRDKNLSHFSYDVFINILGDSFEMIHYYFSTITTSNNPKVQKQNYSSWNMYLVELTLFCLEHGNTTVPEKYLSKMFISQNKHNEHISAPNDLQNWVLYIIRFYTETLANNNLSIALLESYPDMIKKSYANRNITRDPNLNISFSLARNMLIEKVILDYLIREAYLCTLISTYDTAKTEQIISTLGKIVVEENNHLTNVRYYAFALYCLCANCKLSIDDITTIQSNYMAIISIPNYNAEMIFKTKIHYLIFLITIYQKDINQICNITNKTQISAVMDEIIILYDISYGIDALYLYFLAKSKYVAFIKNTIKERKKLVQDIELFRYIIEQQFSCDKSIKENISHSLNKLISFIKNL